MDYFNETETVVVSKYSEKIRQPRQALPDYRCEKCSVLLFKGYLDGEIKCRSCGYVQTVKNHPSPKGTGHVA